MVSRATHYHNQKRHSQRGFGKSKAPALDETTWLSRGMATCRELVGEHNDTFPTQDFQAEMGISFEEAERRLRYLARLGYLRMAVVREGNTFCGYSWCLYNPDLLSD